MYPYLHIIYQYMQKEDGEAPWLSTKGAICNIYSFYLTLHRSGNSTQLTGCVPSLTCYKMLGHIHPHELLLPQAKTHST